MIEAPVSFTRSKIVKCWEDDPWDRFLPVHEGFVHDFVLSLRGNEVPVAFSMWLALMAISSCVKREAWLNWHPTRLFPNLYLIIISPAGEAKKGVVIDQFASVLQMMQRNIENENVAKMKEMKVFEDKITSEGLSKFFKLYLGKNSSIQLLDPDGLPILDKKTGKAAIYKKTAEITLVAEELGTMLSRAKYNEDLLTTLTSWFNTRDTGGELTVKRGRITTRNHFTNFVGGTTPDAFRDSIPKSATNEGFLSRTIICHIPRTVQCFPLPQGSAIKREDLAERLAWIGEANCGTFKITEGQCQGDWQLGKEAEAFYDAWYRALKKDFDKRRFHPAHQSRMGITALKIAMLLMMQRYVDYRKREKRIVDIEAMKEAIALLEATHETAVGAIEEVEASPLGKMEMRVLRYMKEKGKVSRKTLLQNLRFTAAEATAVISDLHSCGKIITLRDGEVVDVPYNKLQEEYTLMGDAK